MDLVDFFQDAFTGLNNQVGIIWAINLTMMVGMGVMFFVFMRSMSRTMLTTAKDRIRVDELATAMYAGSQKDEKEKANLYKELADVRVRVATLDSEYVTYKRMSERIMSAQNELNEKEREERVSERNRHLEQVAQLSKHIDELHAENAQLIQRLSDVEKQQGELVRQIDIIKTEREQLQIEKSASETRNQKQAQEIAELKQCIDELREENKDLKRKIQEIERYEETQRTVDIVGALVDVISNSDSPGADGSPDSDGHVGADGSSD